MEEKAELPRLRADMRGLRLDDPFAPVLVDQRHPCAFAVGRKAQSRVGGIVDERKSGTLLGRAQFDPDRSRRIPQAQDRSPICFSGDGTAVLSMLVNQLDG